MLKNNNVMKMLGFMALGVFMGFLCGVVFGEGAKNVKFIGEMAEVNAYAVATHYKEFAQKGQTREFVGSYDIHLSKSYGDWRIDKIKYNLKYSAGNMSLE